MGARRISNATNEKIIALMSIGKTGEQAAFTVGVSGSYCNKLWNVVKYIANAQWDELIAYSKIATTGGGDYMGLRIPRYAVAAGSRGDYRGGKVPHSNAQSGRSSTEARASRRAD